MQKTNLIVNIKRRICQRVFLATACLLLLTSCTKYGNPLPCTPETDLCKATLTLDIATFDIMGAANTRSFVTGNSDENRIRDIWVFQYDANSGGSMKNPVYLTDFDSNDIQVELTKNEEGTASVVCIVANTGSNNWALDENGNIATGFETYDEFLQQRLPDNVSEPFLSSHMGAAGNAIPMFGISSTMTITSKCYVSVPLIRMFARVEVKIDPAYIHETGMDIENLTFYNIPKYCRVSTVAPAGGSENAATYPGGILWDKFDAGNVDDIIIYVPENIQGKISGMTSKTEAAEEDIPEKALLIEFTVSYASGTKTHIYKIYPGLNMINDFNIKRNHIYNVNIRISKLPE